MFDRGLRRERKDRAQLSARDELGAGRRRVSPSSAHTAAVAVPRLLYLLLFTHPNPARAPGGRGRRARSDAARLRRLTTRTSRSPLANQVPLRPPTAAGAHCPRPRRTRPTAGLIHELPSDPRESPGLFTWTPVRRTIQVARTGRRGLGDESPLRPGGETSAASFSKPAARHRFLARRVGRRRRSKPTARRPPLPRHRRRLRKKPAARVDEL